MPDPPEALRAVAALLKPGGVIFITQTFQRKNLPLLNVMKPAAKYLTTIDFGQLTFESDILSIIERANMDVVENVIIPNSVDNTLQVARLIVVRPRQ